MSTTENTNGWGPTLGALAGAVVGDNLGLGGRRHDHGHGHGPALATADQVAFQVQGLRETIQSDANAAALAALAGQISGVNANTNAAVGAASAAIGCAVGGVKDAVVSASQQAALAHCNLGNQIAQGFASVNTSMATHFGDLKYTLLQQTVETKNGEINRQLAEITRLHNDAKHQQTQVMVQNLVNQGNA